MLAQLASVQGVLYHGFENETIVCARTTNGYFQYLFVPWDCHHTGTVNLNLKFQAQLAEEASCLRSSATPRWAYFFFQT